jgi:hypothetical protein
MFGTVVRPFEDAAVDALMRCPPFAGNIIYAVNTTTWVVSLVYFNASGATNVTSASYDPNLGASAWRWMPFF